MNTGSTTLSPDTPTVAEIASAVAFRQVCHLLTIEEAAAAFGLPVEAVERAADKGHIAAAALNDAAGDILRVVWTGDGAFDKWARREQHRAAEADAIEAFFGERPGVNVAGWWPFHDGLVRFARSPHGRVSHVVEHVVLRFDGELGIGSLCGYVMPAGSTTPHAPRDTCEKCASRVA